jgi:hypothetical protein
MPEVLSPDDDVDIERQEVAQISPSALAILNQSEHAAMVQTANLRGNRRSTGEFMNRLREYAAPNQTVALLMFYSLPRANKRIIGPSIRFAEVAAPCWRNCAVGARAMGEPSATVVTGQGVFIDYEVNLRNAIEVPKRITDSNGNRYSDDMIVVTTNAAMSVARRNAVLKGGIPQALWIQGYDHAMRVAVGDSPSHDKRIADAMEYLTKSGITEWQILNSVGVASPKDLETEHLVTLRVMASELKRGEKTIEQIFGSPYDKEIIALFTQLKKNDTQQRMLRQSYMGRAKDLLEYLRGQLPTIASTQATASAPPPPVQTVRVAETSTAEFGETQPIVQESVPVQESAPQEEQQAEAEYPMPQGETSFGFGENAGTNEPAPAPKRGRGRPPKAAPVEPDESQNEQEDDQFAF